jgi:DNA processing protein
MAAMAGMTVVVEAAERSGSLITVDLAADLGRDLGAVPGPVGSRLSVGPNNLLAGGACLVRDAQDVLDAMLGAGVRSVERRGPALGRLATRALASIERGADTCDAVAEDLDTGGAAAATALAELEAAGYVSCTLLGTYTRTPLLPPVEGERGGGN